MARLEKTIQDYQKQLKVKGIEDISDFIQSIVDADLTKGKYSRFLLDCFLNDKFREEDLKGGLNSTVGIAISLFHKHKAKLPKEMRSVYKYDSPGDLWNAVKQFDGELSGKELKRKEQDQVYAETEFLYEDTEIGFKIISPLTEDAAKWWGKGTRWCTAAENNNAFWNYAEDAPLLVIFMPGGEKLQLWKGKNNIQFMDEADNNVKIDYIKKNWTILEPLCLWLKGLRYIPEELRDYNLCLEAVKQTGSSLPYVPNKHKDYNICMEAVKNNGYTLKDIPEKLIDYNLCLEAIKNNGYALAFVSEELINYNICLEAVKQNGYALPYVPKEHRDYNFCLEVVKNNGNIIGQIPKEMITEEMCKLAVAQNGIALQYAPEEYRSYDVCLEAVKNNKKALNYVPDKYKNKLQDKLQDKDKKYINKIIQQIPEDIYQQVFSEIRSIFPEKELSLKL